MILFIIEDLCYLISENEVERWSGAFPCSKIKWTVLCPLDARRGADNSWHAGRWLLQAENISSVPTEFPA